MRTHLAVASAILTMFVALVAAQASQLSGTARDESGKVLPGVTITVTGPALDKAQTTTTDAGGKFTFKSLPPGKGYVVTFSLIYFRSVVRRNVEVAVEKEATADAVMRIQPEPSPTAPRGFGIVPLTEP